MKKLFNYSKALHWAVFICFFFPFFYGGCGPTADEKATAEKLKQDSIVAVQAAQMPEQPDTAAIPLTDTTTINSDTAVSHTDDAASENTEAEFGKKMPSEKIALKYPFLKPVLIPRPDTHTGIASVIDAIALVAFFSIFIAFLLLLISLIAKYTDKNARIIIFITELFALIAFIFARSYSLDCEKLWGYWLCFSLIAILTVYDFVLIFLNRRSRPSETEK